MAKSKFVIAFVFLLMVGVSSSSIGGKPLIRKAERTAETRVEVDPHGAMMAEGREMVHDDEESLVDASVHEDSMEGNDEETEDAFDEEASDDGDDPEDGQPEEQELDQEPDPEEQEESGENKTAGSMLDQASASTDSSGPVNCVWGSWGSWTSCTYPWGHRRRSWHHYEKDDPYWNHSWHYYQLAKCQGTRVRTRTQTTEASNGGKCDGEFLGMGTCTQARRRRLGCPQYRRRRRDLD
ncbi:unnamed protein product [Prorocentrum cordatum]|uniref:Uncharacterized protein n=1 Tax=Prorocentrum cordatum TaxID=2364126 RepID=A0ABN9U5M7_9DINO|nr:unnamed protein product [Polarella glacialis]